MSDSYYGGVSLNDRWRHLMTMPVKKEKKISSVCRIANRIPRSINRSEAFKTAWKIVKDGGYELKVAGVSFGSRQEALSRLTRYNPKDIHTYLVPEYDNEYDKNAIAVYVLVDFTSCSYRLGYIPKNETSIAKNYIGKIPELKILDGDIRGARVIFDKQIETVVEKPELKLVSETVKQVRKPRTPRMKRENIDPALLGWKGWTWNPKKLVWTKACNW